MKAAHQFVKKVENIQTKSFLFESLEKNIYNPGLFKKLKNLHL